MRTEPSSVQALHRAHRSNLLDHCDTRAVRKRLPGGAVSVRNLYLTTPTFNFVTNLEVTGTDLSSVLSGPGVDVPYVLWSGPPSAITRLGATHIGTYRVVYRLPRPDSVRGTAASKILRMPEERSADIVDLAVAACGVEPARPLFECWARDRRYIWLANEGGVIVLRPGYGIICAYEGAVVESERGKGYGHDLKVAANQVADDLGLPLVAHVRPDGTMERICLKTGDRAAFDDRFYRVVATDSKPQMG